MIGIMRSEGAAFLKWWLQELRELGEVLLERLAPRAARRLIIRFGDRVASARVLRSGQNALSFEFARDEHGDWPARLDQPGAARDYQGARVTLVLAPSEVFKFDLVLPELPERDVKALIELHLERQWPVARDRYAVDYRITQRLRARRCIALQVLLARHEHIERLRELAQGWGLRPVRIGAADESAEIVGDFLPRRFRLRQIRSLTLAPLERRLATTAAALAFALIVDIAGQWVYERIVVGTALARVSQRATAAARLAREIAADSLPVRELSRISASPDAAAVLESLSRSVPPNAWVYELDISAPPASTPHIRLTAFAPAAGTLVDVLQQTHRFGKVRLDWAVSNGTASGRDQLQLTASSDASDAVQDMQDGGMP